MRNRDDNINWSKVNIKKVASLYESIFTTEELLQVKRNISTKSDNDFKEIDEYIKLGNVEKAWAIFWR